MTGQTVVLPPVLALSEPAVDPLADQLPLIKDVSAVFEAHGVSVPVVAVIELIADALDRTPTRQGGRLVIPS
jgi:hypothetical protein